MLKTRIAPVLKIVIIKIINIKLKCGLSIYGSTALVNLVYVYSRGGPQTAPAPRPSLIYCASREPWSLFQFLNLYTVSRTPWTGDQPLTRPLPAHRTTQTQNKHRHPCLEWDSNPRLQCLSGRRSSCLRPYGHCDRLKYDQKRYKVRKAVDICVHNCILGLQHCVCTRMGRSRLLHWG
jgi:hypothetical protein